MSWDVKPLDEVVENFIDYRGKTPNKTNQGIPLITAKIVKDGRLLEANEYIAEADYDDWMTRGYPEIDDVVLTTEAPLGEVALIKDKNVALAQRIITLRGCRDKLNNKFLKYWFQSEYGQYELDSRASGTTVFGIKASVLKKVPVPVPPLPEQKAIASVLSSLDDKIDLLHLQNKTLEAMAETLFRQWFIEEAKEDWMEVQVKDFTTLNRRSVGKNYKLSDILYLDTGSLTKGVVGELQSYELSEAPSRAKRLVQHNDILISTVRPNQCHYGIVSEPQDNLVVSTGFCTITCESISPYFVYLLLTNTEMTEYLHSIAEGSTSTYPSLKPEDIGSVTFQMPPKGLLQQFHNLAESYWQKIHSNHKQIQTLENLRDTLLPKLMSGEVRVQYQTEEVA
ncbi:restriction endonuclease subunit S [Acinetobacter pittii]